MFYCRHKHSWKLSRVLLEENPTVSHLQTFKCFCSNGDLQLLTLVNSWPATVWLFINSLSASLKWDEILNLNMKVLPMFFQLSLQKQHFCFSVQLRSLSVIPLHITVKRLDAARGTNTVRVISSIPPCGSADKAKHRHQTAQHFHGGDAHTTWRMMGMTHDEGCWTRVMTCAQRVLLREKVYSKKIAKSTEVTQSADNSVTAEWSLSVSNNLLSSSRFST